MLFRSTFTDDCSRFRVVCLLENESDAFVAFKTFVSFAQTQTGRRLKCLRDDKGGECTSDEFQRCHDDLGIRRQHSTRNHPQQNGVTERMNRTLSERVTCLLNESGMPNRWWGECLVATGCPPGRSQ